MEYYSLLHFSYRMLESDDTLDELLDHYLKIMQRSVCIL